MLKSKSKIVNAKLWPITRCYKSKNCDNIGVRYNLLSLEEVRTTILVIFFYSAKKIESRYVWTVEQEYDDFKSFSARVKRAVKTTPTDVTEQAINSMGKGIYQNILQKGQEIRSWQFHKYEFEFYIVLFLHKIFSPNVPFVIALSSFISVLFRRQNWKSSRWYYFCIIKVCRS